MVRVTSRRGKKLLTQPGIHSAASAASRIAIEMPSLIPMTPLGSKIRIYSQPLKGVGWKAPFLVFSPFTSQEGMNAIR
jgi:hypothetical protein